jgi:glycine cleavage system T protein (aminomethyltransferase)
MIDDRGLNLLTAAGEPLRVLPTPLHMQTSIACQTNQWIERQGFTVPETYTSVEGEYDALVHGVALTDLSPTGKYTITGSDAAFFVNHLVMADVSKLAPGMSVLSPMCHTNGKVINILEISSLSEHIWWVTTSGRHLHWMQDVAASFDVRIEDRSDDYAGIGLFGPLSDEIIGAAGLDKLSELAMGQARHFALKGMDLIVSHTLVGKERGFKIWCSAQKGAVFWSRLAEVGKNFGLKCAGREAQEILRIDNGLAAAGHEFIPAPEAIHANRRRSAIELGFSLLFDAEKEVFNGRSALLEETKRGTALLLVQMMFPEEPPVVGTHIVSGDKKEPIGFVTSSASVPGQIGARALGFLRPEFAVANEELCAVTTRRNEIFRTEEKGVGRVLSVVSHP